MRQQTKLLITLALCASTLTIQLTQVGTVGTTKVYKVKDTVAVCAKSTLSIQADGSPRAYHPDGTPPGLDYVSHAGQPGNWIGLATNTGKGSGFPLIQQLEDPQPSFYVSTTALRDSAFAYNDPRGYPDAEKVPYLTVPRNSAQKFGWRIGDFGTVCTTGGSASCVHGVVGDFSKENVFGRVSIQLAKALGLESDPKKGGVDDQTVVYVVYARSATQRTQAIPTAAQIQATAQKLFEQNHGKEIVAAL